MANLEDARRSADTAYAAAASENAHGLQRKLAELRNSLAARGIVMSGAMTVGAARLYAEHARFLIQTRLDGLLDGYELHDVPLDEALVDSTIKEILELRTSLLANVARSATTVDVGPPGLQVFTQQLEAECGVSAAWVKTQIDKRRLTAKRKAQAAATANIYHVHGHNPRWNLNTVDNSVNVVTVSATQVFADLRQAIQTGVPEGDEQKDILVRLMELEQAQQSPSFAQRYADFISAAANHMTLIGPFIPALTELLHRVLT